MCGIVAYVGPRPARGDRQFTIEDGADQQLWYSFVDRLVPGAAETPASHAESRTTPARSASEGR